MSLLSGFGSEKRQPASNGISDLSETGVDKQVKGLTNLYTPEDNATSTINDIAQFLFEKEKITQQQLSQIRQSQKERQGTELSLIISELQFADDAQIAQAQAELYGFDVRKIEPENIDEGVFDKLEAGYIKENCVVPIAAEGEKLTVAMSKPGDIFIIEDVRHKTQMDVQVVVCSQEDIEAVCEYFQQKKSDDQLDNNLNEIISDMTEVEIIEEKQEESEDLERMAGQSPVIKFVNYLISNAIREGASDIHIEPKKNASKIRNRIDGVLFETMESPSKMHPAIISRIKIMANLDISEHRLPQDGKIGVRVSGRGIDLRVSILPTNYGEKAVIRVLDSKSIVRGLEKLGMNPDVTEIFRGQVESPHGILLVTGPTGSGKSTTLYSSLCQMDGEKLNISTVEDPVEYELDFCNQVQVNDKIGLSFASALRSLLRQDPDIIMIGEIRDEETARIAVQAALTGHLVLSTLHTNDAPSSVTRLVNIGIDNYLIAASLNAVLAQRLVRKICPKCREAYKPPENMKKFINENGISEGELFKGAGCEHCRDSGYVGRIGIYELMVIDDKFRDMINKDSSVSNMRRVFRRSDSPSLFDDGVSKIKQGLTTIEEVLRVTQACEKRQDS